MPATSLSFSEKSVKADPLAIDDLSLKQPAFSIKTTVYDAYTPPHDSQLSAMPCLEEYSLASSTPLVLTADPRCSSQVVQGVCGTCARVPFNAAVPVDTDLFSGHLVVAVRGLPGTPAPTFKGTKWMGKTVFQGKFKRPISAADLWVGQELWNEPLLPESLRRLVFTTAAKFFSSTCKVKTQGDGVGFMNPLLAMCQTINVSRPGEQPDPTGPVEEDMTLCGSSSLLDKKGQPLSGAARQKYFDNLKNLATFQFDAEHVHTFVILQSFLDLQQYKLSLGGPLTMDLSQILNGQPLQMMVKNTKENQTVMSVLVWHQRLNYPNAGSRLNSRSSLTSSCSTNSGSYPASGMSRCSSSGLISNGSSSSGGLISNGSSSSGGLISNGSSLGESSIRTSSSSASSSGSSLDCGGSNKDQDICCNSPAADDCISEYASACSGSDDDDCDRHVEQDLSGCDQQQEQSQGHVPQHHEQHSTKKSKSSKVAMYLKKKASRLFAKGKP